MGGAICMVYSHIHVYIVVSVNCCLYLLHSVIHVKKHAYMNNYGCEICRSSRHTHAHAMYTHMHVMYTHTHVMYT
jgi:hypothetical protein